MSSFIGSFLARRSLRAAFPCRQRQSLFYSSLISSSSPPSRLLRDQNLNPTKPPFIVPFRFASSMGGTDVRLKRVLDSEIQCAEESDSQVQEAVIPDGFPFEIIDKPGDQAITLRREFGGETIEVFVIMDLDREEGEDDHEDDSAKEDDDSAKEDGSGDDKESSSQLNLSLIVKIEKDGRCLQFSCMGNPDEIHIEDISLKRSDASEEEPLYEGPDFADLDENLQKEMYKYLEVRGVKSSLVPFLQDYTMKKEEREYLVWLKNMKEFIEH